jgi:uncharacterized membrane protein YedE/YeeE
MQVLHDAWPWYLAGPVIGLFPPLLLLVGNKMFGISSNLRHICAACMPGGAEYFSYDWRREGAWNLTFVLGVLVGGFLEGHLLATLGPPRLSAAALESLAALGIHDVNGLVPRELFSWHSLTTLPGFVLIVVGGFLVGFGTAFAGGCTSGHAISGLADLQLPSLLAVLGFFAGGLISTWLILPRLLGG